MAGAVVCGAGAAGLAAGAMLRRVGVDAVVVERSDRLAASWRSRHAALRLNTPGWMSTQPGYRATRRRYGEFPSRDSWIRYLEDYAAHHRLQLRLGTEVERIARDDGAWRVHTSGGPLKAQAVVIATGFDREPHLPEWPGRERFNGELIHAGASAAARRRRAPLVGHLGVLDGRGMPLVHGSRQHPAAPGLYFTGFRGELSGKLRLMRFDARAIARAAAGRA
jgi:cation diffusion facilitator CzcD-associated flavoprotein CzcO